MGRGTPIVPIAFMSNASGANFTAGLDQSPCLRIGGDGGNAMAASIGSAVRRLTPRECERLQGFPDDYTLIPWRKGMAPDGPRYKALGNSMAVPVMRWIGERIAAVEGGAGYPRQQAARPLAPPTRMRDALGLDATRSPEPQAATSLQV